MNFDPLKPFTIVLIDRTVHSVPSGYRVFSESITDSKALSFYDASRNTIFVVPVKNISFITQPQDA